MVIFVGQRARREKGFGSFHLCQAQKPTGKKSQQGSNGMRQAHFIEKGLTKLYLESGNKEVSLWYNRENEIVLSVQSYFTQTPSQFTIRAVEPCQLYYLLHSDMHHLLRQYSELNIHGRVILQHYYGLSEMHVGHLLRSPRERFDRIGELYPWMVDGSRLNDKMLAAYIGVTPACISYYRNGRGRNAV